MQVAQAGTSEEEEIVLKLGYKDHHNPSLAAVSVVIMGVVVTENPNSTGCT